MREHITSILVAISATLIVLSLYVFGVPMLDIIGHILATCGLLLGVGIIIYLAIIAIRSNRKSKDEVAVPSKTSSQISINISLNCNTTKLSEISTFLKELRNMDSIQETGLGLLQKIEHKLDKQQKQLDKLMKSNNRMAWLSAMIFGGGLIVTGLAGVLTSFLNIGTIVALREFTSGVALIGIIIVVVSCIGDQLVKRNRQ